RAGAWTPCSRPSPRRDSRSWRCTRSSWCTTTTRRWTPAGSTNPGPARHDNVQARPRPRRAYRQTALRRPGAGRALAGRPPRRPGPPPGPHLGDVVEDNLVLRGSMLLHAWVPDRAREPADIDWVVVGPAV